MYHPLPHGHRRMLLIHCNLNVIKPVIAKYAGHVRHDFEMSGREFKHCWTFCPAVVNAKEMSGREKYIKYPSESFLFAGHQVAKCPAGNQNVWQSTECQSGNLSGNPEIILAITVKLIVQDLCRLN